jgi:hypothetical protein
MTDGVFPLVELAIQLCIARGVREFVIAPGSRSAPLTIALAHHPNINVRVVYDERSAGYVALGMAQQLHRPVGLVCTSGTAALNFGPAVAEAFYQQDSAAPPSPPTARQSGSTSRTIRRFTRPASTCRMCVPATACRSTMGAEIRAGSPRG